MTEHTHIHESAFVGLTHMHKLFFNARTWNTYKYHKRSYVSVIQKPKLQTSSSCFVLFRMSVEGNYGLRKTIIWSAALLIIRFIISVYSPIHRIQTNEAQMPADYGTRHSADEGQNTCSFTSTPPYTFTVRCLIQHMNNSNTHCINILIA
jgi:hypothetical protein